jgi:hippurate hydrolase
MPIINRIAAFHGDMTAWRRHIHAHPETAFEEKATADFVAGKLAEFGIEVNRGLAGTGVVGTLRSGTGQGAIGLRADLDALHIHEANGFDHRSQNDGRMHACGHDGHTAMLLGAARYLAETRRFSGTVHFIFQPAEENEGGGRVMVEQGLFQQHPVAAVYGMHNWPGLPAGRFALRAGPIMASFDIFEITITGKGAHAAMPHRGTDPVVAGAAIVAALQTIASRQASPLESVVVTVTQFHAGDTWNVIPQQAVLRGTARSFRPDLRDMIEESVRRIAESIAAAHRASVTVRFERRYPATVNSEQETEFAAAAMVEVVGQDKVERSLAPSMASEDFAFMLEARPGAYVWIGNGGDNSGPGLHHPAYDFNDEILPLGATYWARLVERNLPIG